MYKFIIAAIIVVVMGGLVFVANYSKPVEVENIKLDTATTTVEAVEELPEEWLEEAEKARQAVIDRKRAEAELEAVQSDMELLRARETELEKELNVYWRDRRNLEQLVVDTFPERPRTALAIVQCESQFRTNVQSNHILSYGREQSFGLFQIHAKVHHETALRLGLPDYKTDPEQNAAMARHIYESAGHSFQPWTCYSKNLIAMR